MHLLVNSIASKLGLIAQADVAQQGGTGGVLLFFLAAIVAVFVNIGKDNAVSARVKRSFNVTDPNWGVMFGLFVFGLLLGALPNLFLVVSESALSENAVSGFRVSGLMIAIFSGLYLVFRVFCESSKVREPEQAWRLAVVVAVTILGALYIGVKHGDDKTIKASADIAKKFGMGADDVSRDGSTVLLTEKVAFRNFVLLGAPACGKTTLLRKNQTISHYYLPAWPASPIVFQSTYSV